jgi:hypothetical protein
LLIFIDEFRRRYDAILEFRDEATSPSKIFERSVALDRSVENRNDKNVLKKEESSEMPYGNSPITSSKISGETPVKPEVAIQAVDETLWALIELLVENKLIDPDHLATKIEQIVERGIQNSGPETLRGDQQRLAVDDTLRRVRDGLPPPIK